MAFRISIIYFPLYVTNITVSFGWLRVLLVGKGICYQVPSDLSPFLHIPHVGKRKLIPETKLFSDPTHGLCIHTHKQKCSDYSKEHFQL